ncbi:biotin--[acetyl-CoA-carboxylase] ligase, partial [Acinetobacter baumannii]
LVQFEHSQGLVYGRFVGISNEGAVILETPEPQQFYQGRLRPQTTQ